MEFEKSFRSALQTSEFKSLNGYILRLLNLLKSGDCFLNTLLPMMLDEGYSVDQISTSIDYLKDRHYITVEEKKEVRSVADLLDSFAPRVKVRLTADGIDLLQGVTHSESVEV